MIRIRSTYWLPVIVIWWLLAYTLTSLRLPPKRSAFVAKPVPQKKLPHDRPRPIFQDRPRVAIIGAGAAGSSSAYFLKFLADKQPSLAVDIDLYEANDYVGGRVNSVRAFDDHRSSAVETGASIFVPANKNLWKAVETFDLSVQAGHGGGRASEEAADVLNIYDGEKIVYTESRSALRESVQLFWRYGFRAYKTDKAVDLFVTMFTKLYGKSFQARGPYVAIEAFAKALGLDAFPRLTTSEYFRGLGVSKNFVQEMVSAASTVNYAQGSSSMHAFQGMVTMATGGGASVSGGNNQIFQQFALRSNASIHLRTHVQSITKVNTKSATANSTATHSWLVKSKNLATGQMLAKKYDAIIYAAPLHLDDPSTAPPARIINANISAITPPLPYVHLHVTLVVTNATNPKAAFFNSEGPVSKTVITTLDTFETGQTATKPKVNSLTYLRNLGKLDDETGLGHVVKIFSPKELSDSDLQAAFGTNEVIWVHRKEWASYPYAPPFSEDEVLPLFKPEEDSFFYYTSAMERLVSTMETSTVSAWNAVSLLVQDLFGYKVTQSWAEWQD